MGSLNSLLGVSLLITILLWYGMVEVFKTTKELQEETLLDEGFLPLALL